MTSVFTFLSFVHLERFRIWLEWNWVLASATGYAFGGAFDTLALLCLTIGSLSLLSAAMTQAIMNSIRLLL
jgi:hypothetical protein